MSSELKEKIKSHVDKNYKNKIEELKLLQETYKIEIDEIKSILKSYQIHQDLSEDQHLQGLIENLEKLLKINNSSIGKKVEDPGDKINFDQSSHFIEKIETIINKKNQNIKELTKNLVMNRLPDKKITINSGKSSEENMIKKYQYM